MNNFHFKICSNGCWNITCIHYFLDPYPVYLKKSDLDRFSMNRIRKPCIIEHIVSWKFLPFHPQSMYRFLFHYPNVLLVLIDWKTITNVNNILILVDTTFGHQTPVGRDGNTYARGNALDFLLVAWLKLEYRGENNREILAVTRKTTRKEEPELK
jgi:hypothetical protein